MHVVGIILLDRNIFFIGSEVHAQHVGNLAIFDRDSTSIGKGTRERALRAVEGAAVFIVVSPHQGN